MSYNNSINDNRLNAKKAKSSVYQLKKLLKPLVAMLKHTKKNSYKSSPQPHYFDEFESEINDNLSNESLENEIFEEIDSCEESSAIRVYQDGQLHILPVFRGEHYIPVHFARTEAGTFFWTSMLGADSDIVSEGDENPITEYQTAEIQVACDRWAQA